MSPDRVDEHTRTLDAREIDGESFGDGVAALETLPDDESLLLINGFEPFPLYAVLEDCGFESETSNPEPGAWCVEIWPV